MPSDDRTRPQHIRRRAPTATSRCPTAAAGAAACSCRRSRSACGRTSATTSRSPTAARSCAARSTSGITHFDLANNYGPPLRRRGDQLRPRSSPRTSGPTATSWSSPPRPATTCGRARTANGARASTCWPASTRASPRMGLDYVDIFYSHRFDPDTPLEETMGALDTAVRQGKALYVGISSYAPERTEEAIAILARARHAAAHPPAVLLDAQPLDRGRAARRARARGRRRIVFSPLAQGLLTDKYLDGVPEDSRVRRGELLRRRHAHRGEPRARPRAERDRRRGAARRSPSWRSPGCCATRGSPRSLLGASSVAQLEQNVAALEQPRPRSRRARGDRPPRRRRRDQHLGAVEQRLSDYRW